ncbi:MAG: T9SS type A sorting domain-containing protein, partial [Bacteroidales bacterium]
TERLSTPDITMGVYSKDEDIFNAVLFPNPAGNFFYVSCESNDNSVELVILDMAGRIVLNKKINNNEIINIGTLNAGIYIINIKSKNRVYTKKLVVN